MAKTRQEGIEQKSIGLSTTISQLMTPGIPPSPKASIIAKLNAEATAKTYDSTKDPIVLAASAGAPTLTITSGNTFTFPHALGYIPIVQIVCTDSVAASPYVQDLDGATCKIYNPNSGSVHIKVYCH